MAAAPLLEQITQNPLLVTATGEQLFEASVRHLLAHPHAEQMIQAASGDEDFWPKPDTWEAQFRPYVVKDGVLQIPIMGVLLNRFPWQFGRWATGYAYIERALARGLEDANVKGIAFLCHSPGGEVAGCFELTDKIYEARGKKSMRAFAADAAYSAAYALASAADSIVITRSGGVGSVGVVTAHVEFSEALKEMGVKITFIFAGKHKVDGNPYEKLPANVKTRIQERIDRTYAVFTSTVARDRAMEDSDVRATEALTYDGQDAIDVGFADRIGSLEDEMVIFSDECDIGDGEMANDNSDKGTITQAMCDDLVAKATVAATAAGKAEGFKEGAVAAQARINTILGSDEGKARPKAAMSLALKTSMSADEAKAVLTDMPEEKAAAPEPAPPEKKKMSAFELAMENGNPDVGAGGDPDKDQANTPDNLSQGILSAYAGAGGFDAKKPKAA